MQQLYHNPKKNPHFFIDGLFCVKNLINASRIEEITIGFVMTKENLKTLIAWMDNHVDDNHTKKEMVERIKMIIDLLQRFERDYS